MIVIVDYGMGNLRSVEKALISLGAPVRISDDPGIIAKADKLILPGVGAFGDGMKNIRDYGIEDAIIGVAAAGRPFLGICLGMQMLFEDGEENPGVRGLGIIKGSVRKFDPAVLGPRGLKIPHMGWNQVTRSKTSSLFDGIEDGSNFYFVHSYYPAPLEDVTVGVTDYGIGFASVIQKNNVAATQFHPEKSQKNGLRLLLNFIQQRG